MLAYIKPIKQCPVTQKSLRHYTQTRYWWRRNYCRYMVCNDSRTVGNYEKYFKEIFIIQQQAYIMEQILVQDSSALRNMSFRFWLQAWLCLVLKSAYKSYCKPISRALNSLDVFALNYCRIYCLLQISFWSSEALLWPPWFWCQPAAIIWKPFMKGLPHGTSLCWLVSVLPFDPRSTIRNYVQLRKLHFMF